MMMPANYSAIAENEMTYVVGGGLVETLAPVMNEKNWQNFNVNVIELIGNSFVNSFVADTLGTIFNGHYTPGDASANLWNNNVKALWDNNYENAEKKNFWTGSKAVLNIALRGVGALASIYTLGQGTIGFAGDKSFKV